MPYKDKEKQKAAQRASYERNKDKFVENSNHQRLKRKQQLMEYKSQLSCVRCGYNENPIALDFHHRDPTKKDMNVSAMISRYSLSRVLEEIAKCDVLCANCHRVVHSELFFEKSPSKQDGA